MEEVIVRTAILAYAFLSPLFMIYLQQGLFKDTFDDEHGSKLIFRLHATTCVVCITVYAMTYGVCPGGRFIP